MSSEKLTKLETFIERHRPDFDAHEPSPDLWARLEQQLGPPGASLGPVLAGEETAPSALTEAGSRPLPPALAALPMTASATVQGLSARLAGLRAALPMTASATAATAAPRRGYWARYGAAAALALLAAVAVFNGSRRAAPATGATAMTALPRETFASAGVPAGTVSLGPAPEEMAAAEQEHFAPDGSRTTDPRLSVAVRGMETYYAAQLSRREAELRRLDARNAAVEWPRELAGLDSSYRQLRDELPHHPQPEAVLTAMNRNLQIRLDILDQQLQHRAASPPEPVASGAGGTMVSLADSRSQP